LRWPESLFARWRAAMRWPRPLRRAGFARPGGAVRADARRRQRIDASEERPSAPPPFVRPRVMAVRIDTAEAPKIDADLSDPVWAKAAVIDNFTQRSPNPYEPATERTVVRILYDENNLYFSFYNYDSTPEAIVVRNMQRDGQLFTSDSVMIYLDPGQTRRNAYNFEIGASGAAATSSNSTTPRN